MDNIKVFINSITGESPFHIYICQPNINECFYVDTITGTTHNFDIPKPFDNNTSYFLKVIDNNENIIIGSMGITPSITPSITLTPTPTASVFGGG